MPNKNIWLGDDDHDDDGDSFVVRGGLLSNQGLLTAFGRHPPIERDSKDRIYIFARYLFVCVACAWIYLCRLPTGGQK